VTAVTALELLAGVLGLLFGVAVNRTAGRFPVGTGATGLAVRPPLVELTTGAAFWLVAWRFGLTWELPAYLCFAAAAVLLAVIDLQHRLLPDRVTGPATVVGALLLTLAAAVEGEWPALLRAGLAAVALFTVYLVMALISPRGIFMGDVKLAGLIGLHLGWLGWGVVVAGAAAGFVVQAVLALVLLAERRVTLRSELPFGPAMLVGAALAIGWSSLSVI
jgi:leader peptidase (prepilin peptidase)/N-methyltransferase